MEFICIILHINGMKISFHKRMNVGDVFHLTEGYELHPKDRMFSSQVSSGVAHPHRSLLVVFLPFSRSVSLHRDSGSTKSILCNVKRALPRQKSGN